MSWRHRTPSEHFWYLLGAGICILIVGGIFACTGVVVGLLIRLLLGRPLLAAANPARIVCLGALVWGCAGFVRSVIQHWPHADSDPRGTP